MSFSRVRNMPASPEARGRKHRRQGTQTVQPIHEREAVERMFRVAAEHDQKTGLYPFSWELLLLIGFNTGMRISDLLLLRVRDVRRENGEVHYTAKKTGKFTYAYLDTQARRTARMLTDGRGEDEWLFPSRERVRQGKEHGWQREEGDYPITPARAYQVIREIARQARVSEKVGTHTMRKTFGWFVYEETGDVRKVMQLLRHDSMESTLRYIGAEQEDLKQTVYASAHFGLGRMR